MNDNIRYALDTETGIAWGPVPEMPFGQDWDEFDRRFKAWKILYLPEGAEPTLEDALIAVAEGIRSGGAGDDDMLAMGTEASRVFAANGVDLTQPLITRAWEDKA